MYRLQSLFIILGYWTSMFAEGATKIIIPLYFNSIGFSASKIAGLFLAYEAFGFVTNYLSGLIINRIGYKKAFLISLALHSIASFGYLAPEGMIKTAMFIAFLRATRGIGKELTKTSSSAYFKVLSVDKGKHGMIHLLLGGKDSFKGIGLLVGVYLYQFLGFRISFAILGGATAALLILTPKFISDIRETKKVSYKGFFNVSNVMFRLSIIRTFLYVGRDIWFHVPILVYLPSIGMSNSAVGICMASGLLIFGASQALAGGFIKQKITIGKKVWKNRWTYQTVLPAFSFLLMLMPLSMIVFIDRPSYMFVLVLAYNFFAGFSTAPHNYLHVALAQKERASVDIAFYKTISEIGSVIATGISGLVYDTWGILGCLSISMFGILISGALSEWLPETESLEEEE